MPLPKQVARQAAEADRIVRNLNGANEPPSADTPPVSQDIAPPATQTAQAATPAPQPPVATQPIAPPPQPPAAPPPQTSEWETRYHTLQGKYNAEVPALQGQLQNAMQAMGNMGRELDAIKAQLATAKAAPPPTPQRQVTDQDVTTWGVDMLDVIKRQAAEETARMIQPLIAENEQLRATLANVQGQTQQVQQTQQQSREQMFWTRLQEVVPNWQAMNSDTGFLAWLNEYDPMIGQTRKFALDSAQSQLNADRAGAFFNAYKRTLPPPPSATPQDELAKQINPGQRAAGSQQQFAPPPGAQTIEIWSSQEVSDFYTDVSRGRYRNSPDEYTRLNEAITRAVAEGRVR